MSGTPVDAVSLRLIWHVEFVALENRPSIVECLEEFSQPAKRRSVYHDLVQSTAARKAAGLRALELAEQWPQDLRERIEQTLQTPFSAQAAHDLRSQLGSAPPELLAAVGAYARYRVAAGACKLNGNQIRSVIRANWSSEGLARHPLRLTMACPQCGQSAPVTAFASTSAGYYHTEHAELRCEACGLAESYPGGDIASFMVERELPSDPEVIRQAFELDPTVTSVGTSGQRRREALLSRLRELLPTLPQEIKSRMLSLPERFRNANRPSNGLWTLRLYGHVSSVPDSVLTSGNAVPVAGSDKHNVPTSDWDEALSDLPLSEVRIVESPVADPLAHWKSDFQLAVLHVQRALDSGDAVEAAVRAVLLLQSIHRIGVASNWQLVVPADKVPLSARWLWESASSLPAKPVSRLPSTDIEPLAQYLAKALEQEQQPHTPETLTRLLAAFAPAA